LRALLDDPAHVVGLMLGQRAGFFRGVVSRGHAGAQGSRPTER
jgi:hypothetical protein